MHALRLIRRHFVEGLDGDAERRLRDHLRACAACRAEYDRTAEVLRAAAGRTPTRGETAAARGAALAGIAGTPTGDRPRSRLWLPRLAPALAALVLVALTAVLALTRPPRPDDGVALRGGPTGRLAWAEVEVYAVRERDGQFGTPRLVPEGGALALSDYIQFRYQHGGPGQRFLYLLGVDARREPLDYFPRPDRDASIPLAEDQMARMQTVGPSIRLAKRHAPGALYVCALFSSVPLERREVHARVVRALERQGPSSALLAGIDFGAEVLAVVRRFQVVRDGGT